MADLAVVICHGSYHSPAPYELLVAALQAKGVEAHCPQLPTADLAKLNVGDPSNPNFDLGPPQDGYPQGGEDAEAVLEVVRQLVKRGKRVLLLAHSSGGWVATQAAEPELQIKARKEQELEGGIIGILYMGAFIIPTGESVSSFFQPKDGSFVTPPFMRFHAPGPAGLGTMVEPEKFLFNGVEPTLAEKYAKTLTASPILTTKLTNNAYASLPCGYLVLEGDLTLPKEYQESMVALQASKTGPFTIYRCPAGHSPHLSWTRGVADTVLQFVDSIGV
jgi:pimeloyl-ACP methyl ester carboxylesterase